MIELYSGDAKKMQHFCKVHSYAKLIAETDLLGLLSEAEKIERNIKSGGMQNAQENYKN